MALGFAKFKGNWFNVRIEGEIAENHAILVQTRLSQWLIFFNLTASGLSRLLYSIDNRIDTENISLVDPLRVRLSTVPSPDNPVLFEKCFFSCKVQNIFLVAIFQPIYGYL